MRARSLAALTLLAAIPTFASIRGTVMTRDGLPIGGAKVSIFALQSADDSRVRLLSKTPGRAPIASTTTDSKGVFSFESPKDAVVDLSVEASGHAPAGGHVERDDDAVVMALAAAPAKQGSVSANGKPVAGATVVWVGNAVETLSTTDANGRYTVADPSKWAKHVLVIHPDFAIVDEVFSQQRKANTNFTLDPGVAVSGKVLNGAAPVANATVFVDRWPMTRTADDGSFSVAHAHRSWETLDATSGELAAALTRSEKTNTLKLAPASGITGVVRDAKTQRPVAGAELMISQALPGLGNRALVASTLTDAKGAFTVNVRPGVYDIACTHPSYSTRLANISVVPHQRLQKNVSANAKARLTGMVVDDQKRAIAAAKVSVEPADNGGGMLGRGGRRLAAQLRGGGSEAEAVSGPDGRFTARTTIEGEVEVGASKRGLPDGRSSAFKIASGDRKMGVMITIPRGVTLTGRVLDHDRKPVSGVAIVAVEGEGGGGRPGGGMVRRFIMSFAPTPEDPVLTGTDGTFSLVLKEGDYDLRFSREGFAAKTLRNEQVSASAKPLEVTLDPGVEITGRVVRGAVGIEGVNVVAMEADSRSMAFTGPDGRFTLGDLTPGTYMVIANKGDDFVDQRKSITAPARDITIEVPPGGRITGHVIDKAGHQPVTSFQAGVNRSRSGGGMQIMMPPVTRSFTADDGTFALDNVPAGNVQVIVSAPGFTTARISNITVEENKTTPDVEVALETGVHLTGRVTGQDGSPISGVQVRPSGGMNVPGLPPMPGETNATTDSNGEYSFEQLEAGDNKSFQFSRNGYLSETRSVSLSGKETRLDVQLSSGMTITGMVVTDTGTPVADADIRATSAAAGSMPRTTKSDAGGSFILDTIAPGHYTITAAKNGYAEGVLRDFDATAGGSPRIVIKSGGTISGHVTGLSDADLSKVTVMANGSGGSAEATPDSTGAYRIDGVPIGTVRVTAMLLSGMGNNRSTEAKSVDVAAGAPVTVDLVFSSDTVIRGRVTRNGVPAGNTAVQFIPRGGAAQTRSGGSTDDSGAYTITGLSDGDYTVTVLDMQRLSPYSTTYSVHGSGTFDIDMRTTTLRGHVTDRGDSSPIANARVELQPKDSSGGGRPAMLGAASDDTGTFVIDGVAAGNYTITANKDGYGNVVKDLVLTDSSNPDVTLDLMRNDGVTLNVVDGRDGRQLNAFVSVYDAQNRQVYSSGGRFGGGSDSGRIPLAPGQYRATVSASGYATKTVSIMSPSSQTVSLTPGGTLVIRSSATVTRRAILLDASGSPYARPFSADPSFPITPGETRLQNVVAGQYTLQVLGGNGAVAATKTVVVVEGQESAVDL